MLSIGHAELWIMVINRTHALPIHDTSLKRLRHVLELVIVLFPIVLLLSVGLYAPGVLVVGLGVSSLFGGSLFYCSALWDFSA